MKKGMSMAVSWDIMLIYRQICRNIFWVSSVDLRPQYDPVHILHTVELLFVQVDMRKHVMP